MIIKIKPRRKPSFQQLLDYLLNDKDRLRDREENSFVIVHNLKGSNIDTWVKQFKENEKYRLNKRKDSVKLYHEIISFHDLDSEKVSLDTLEEITREYIKERNPNGMYIAVPHFDKEHYHVHICVSALEYRTGKTMRLDKANLLRLKRTIQQFQQEKFPELNKSIVRHGKGNDKALSDKEWQMKNRTGRASDREILIEKISVCISQAKSKEDLLKLLKKNNLRPYERNGKVTGVWFENRKFRFKRLGIEIDGLFKGNNRGQELEKLRKVKSISTGREH